MYKEIKQNIFLYSNEIIECCAKFGDNDMICPESIIAGILMLWGKESNLTPAQKIQYNIIKKIMIDNNDIDKKMRILNARMETLRKKKEVCDE